MKTASTFVRALVAVTSASSVVFSLGSASCGGDDSTANPADAGREAAPFDATSSDTGGGGQDSAPPPPVDAGTDAPPPPPRLLVTMNNTTTSELVAVNVASGAVDGRLTFPGEIAITYARDDAPWLLEQKADTVARMDRQHPWQVLSSWTTARADGPDGGKSYSDPSAVVAAGANKAYALRFNRNAIAVIDTSAAADGGAPTKWIDLSSLAQPGDGDGVVEAIFGAYVPSRNRVYVLLGNIDLTKADPQGAYLLCSTTVGTVIAIDTTSDSLVSLGGTGPGGAIALTGYNPVLGSGGASAVYDAANDRMLIVNAGCNPQLGDGGPGSIAKRVVEQVVLGTGAAKVLLDANAQDFPGAFAYVGPTEAYIGFGFANDVRRWDPTQSTLGDAVANAPDSYAFVHDGKGNLLGSRTAFLSDGGSSLSIVQTSTADGGTRTLAGNPFTDPTGFVGSVDIWPHP